MKQVAKIFGHSLVAGIAGLAGAILTAGILFALGFNEAGLLPFFVGGIWSGEYMNSVIYA